MLKRKKLRCRLTNRLCSPFRNGSSPVIVLLRVLESSMRNVGNLELQTLDGPDRRLRRISITRDHRPCLVL